MFKYETYGKTKTGHFNPQKRFDGGKPDGTPGANHIKDTIDKFDSASSSVQSKVTTYKKKYDFNISTKDTPTGEHRVLINNNKPDRSTQFPYGRGTKTNAQE